ncbi:uncharacterized protein [Hemitrygon akajei]|uniref:uncharacterized protein isoform X2 n=1 Tax=Hemitrygon akajei TaxID=2704970 RepID=UPI003BF99791
MDESETYENMRLTGTDPQAPWGAEPDVSYVQLNITATSAPRVRRDEGGLSSTYAEVKFPNDEPVIDEDQAPPIAAGPPELPTNAQTAAHEQQPKVKIGNVPFRQICLLCVVIGVFLVIVAGLLIHVSQIRQSMETCHRNYHELNSTLQSKLIALNSNLSVLKQMHSDLRHQFCELLTSKIEQTCSKDWITNKDRSYYVSTFETSFPRAMQECSNRYSRLLEINSRDEALFVFHNLLDYNLVYWTEKCENGNVGQSLLYKASFGIRVCSQCGGLTDVLFHGKGTSRLLYSV